MHRKEIWELLGLLNNEDKEVYTTLWRSKQMNLMLNIFMFVILFTGMIMGTIFLLLDNLPLMILGLFGAFVLFFYFLIKFTNKRYQTQWIDFLDEKSIIFQTSDFNGFKTALEDYISRDINYYTNEKVVDRRAVDKIKE